MKNLKKTKAEKRFQSTQNFDLLGLLLSELAICAISLPFIILGMNAAITLTKVAFIFLGILVVIVGGAIFLLLNMKKLVEWGYSIGDFTFRMLKPKLYNN